MADERFDLVVIGSGPAGQRAAVQGAKIGKRVLLIERAGLGGSCLHTGTIPSKTLREAVIVENNASPDFLERVMNRKNAVIRAEMTVIGEQLKRNHVELRAADARLAGPNQVVLRDAKGVEATVTASVIVLATGTRPRRPTEVPFTAPNLFDSDTLLDVPRLPRSMCVLGAGVIGCEYASIFAAMGTTVTICDRRTDLLRGVDREIVAQLRKRLEAARGRFALGAKYRFVDGRVDGGVGGPADIEIDGRVESFDAILYCMGRIGNVEGLALESAGLAANERGLIDVNANFQTSVPHVYAVGDLIGSPALAAAASEQGRLAVSHSFGLETPGFPKIFPYGIYTIPEISSVGAEESDLVAAKRPYIVGVARYAELARGKIMGDEHGLVKLLFCRDDHKLLGAHIIGTNATELVHLGQFALAFGAKVDDLIAMVFNYPTLAESYKVAALNALNQIRSGTHTKASHP